MNEEMKGILKLYVVYLVIGTPLVYFGGKYLYKIKEKNENKANKISFVLITAPLLAPILIGVFLLISYGLIYVAFSIVPDSMTIIEVPTLILLAVASIYLGIKSYIAIYRSYFNKALDK